MTEGKNKSARGPEGTGGETSLGLLPSLQQGSPGCLKPFPEGCLRSFAAFPLRRRWRKHWEKLSLEFPIATRG